MTESSSTFRAAAIASRLLNEEQIDEALTAINAASDGLPARLVEIADEVLSDKLVDLGHLNRWQAEQLKLGRTKFNLKDYQIVDSIGQGGMGQVFKAEHSMMGRVVAIKVLPKSKSTEEAVASFRHEIRALAHLDHPNLVRAYDAGQDGNVNFLVTEYVPGMDLRRLVRSEGKLSLRDAATIMSQAAMGLEHAHERGLVHRDVKPGNLVVTPDGMTKVLDLGLAGFLQDDVPYEDPRKGRIVGTADYLAPEAVMAPGAATAASDIYALGCTLYYAVTGKVPFPGGTTHEKCYRHMHEAPLHPRRFNQDLTEEFLDILADMMEKDPKKRIGAAAEVVRRLAPWTEQSVGTKLPAEEMLFARVPPTPPPLPNSVLADTQEFPELSATDLESPSQVSQGTVRDSHATNETTPAIEPKAPSAPPLRAAAPAKTPPSKTSSSQAPRQPPRAPQSPDEPGIPLPLVLAAAAIPLVVLLTAAIIIAVWLFLY